MKHTKKKPGCNRAISNNVHLNGELDQDTTPANLSEDQIQEIVRTLSPTANQERRFIQTLARTPKILTKDACRRIACVNLSHLRSVTADRLVRFGLEARCVHPPVPIINGFGEQTGQVQWALYRLGQGES